MASHDDLKENVAQKMPVKGDDGDNEIVSTETPPDSIREVLDDVEAQIEKVREAVIRLSSERDSLIELLDSIGGSLDTTSLSDLHKEEAMLEVDRLTCRVGEVVCQVRIRRIPSQVEALKGVEEEMARLVDTVERDVSCEVGEQMCAGFLAACGGEVMGARQSCQKFEKMVLGCAVEDQKLVRKRLVELMVQIKEIRKAGTVMDEHIEKNKELATNEKDEKQISVSQ
eukprot:TRINITY_DN40652_c0_g1_i1.p1 TRINITY_DN40652_c0_g1~~TRINITY_DN40652_c0_g1_i1.p1  ORF type:complete len:227 (+),score=98.73 TRINITY_DN40652_c0_g1_i1:29-709(+)